MIDARPIHFFDACFRNGNEDLIAVYTDNWVHVLNSYPPGWCYGFWEPNRFLNRVIYNHLIGLSIKRSILDFACYDGLLLAALTSNGFDAYGYESLPCWLMFEALGVKNRVNQQKHCEAVIAFNVAQGYSFKDFIGRLEEENDGTPNIIFFDREPTRQTEYNKTYFDPDFIAKEAIQVVEFPNCVSDRSRADLLIWRAGK